MPDLDLTDQALMSIVNDDAGRGFTIPGVQKKMSLHLSRTRNVSKLTVVDYPIGYILKPQTERFLYLPESEFLVMKMSEATGIATVPAALIRCDGVFAYITKRIDRIIPRTGSGNIQLLAMEDFCQLEQRASRDKYRGSYERCADVIAAYSSRPGIDMTELFIRIVFSFVIGNSDMHLKNLSLIEKTPASQQFILAPAYDMLPVNMILPDDPEQLGLSLNGKKRNLRKKDFISFAYKCGIDEKTAARLIAKIVSMKDTYLQMSGESYLPEDMKLRMSDLIEERAEVLA